MSSADSTLVWGSVEWDQHPQNSFILTLMRLGVAMGAPVWPVSFAGYTQIALVSMPSNPPPPPPPLLATTLASRPF